MAIQEMSMNTHLIAAIALTTLSMCACTPQIGGGDSVSFRHISRIDATHIAVHARGDIADAVVSNVGDLAIDGKAVMLSPAQREDVRAYYMSAENLRKDALATGKAGIATAVTALGSVAKGLASGEPDRIGSEVDQQAAKVEASATKVCRDVADLRARQEALVASVAAFRPYATIGTCETLHCDR